MKAYLFLKLRGCCPNQGSASLKNRLVPSTHRYPKKFFWLVPGTQIFLFVWPVPGIHRYPKFFFSLVPGTKRYRTFKVFSVPGTQRYPRFLNFDGYRPVPRYSWVPGYRSCRALVLTIKIIADFEYGFVRMLIYAMQRFLNYRINIFCVSKSVSI